MISCELTVNFESEENHRICYDSETVWKGEPVMAKEKLVWKVEIGYEYKLFAVYT